MIGELENGRRCFDARRVEWRLDGREKNRQHDRGGATVMVGGDAKRTFDVAPGMLDAVCHQSRLGDQQQREQGKREASSPSGADAQPINEAQPLHNAASIRPH